MIGQAGWKVVGGVRTATEVGGVGGDRGMQGRYRGRGKDNVGGVFAEKNGERSGFSKHSEGGIREGGGAVSIDGGGFAGRNGERSGGGDRDRIGDRKWYVAEAGSGRRDGVGALGRVGGEERRVVGGWALGAAGEIEHKRRAKVACDQRSVPTGKSVNVGHHAGWPMHHMKEVAQKFLGPAAHLVDRAVVFQNFFDTATITKPIESGSPQVLPILSNGPATDGRLADEQVVVVTGM